MAGPAPMRFHGLRDTTDNGGWTGKPPAYALFLLPEGQARLRQVDLTEADLLAIAVQATAALQRVHQHRAEQRRAQ